MLGSKVRVMAIKAVAIRAMVMVIVIVMCRPMVVPMPWMPMSSRGICFVCLKGINQSHLFSISIELTRLSQIIEFRNFFV